MIDWERVEELQEEFGGDGFGEVAALFLDEVVEALERLQTANQSSEHLAAELHFLKGSALNLGFSNLAQLCRDYETLVATGAADDVHPDRLADSFAASRIEFEMRIGQISAA